MAFYNTLNDALESVGLLHTWDISNPPIGYNEYFSYTFDNGTKYGYYVSIYRNENGKYETPVHYSRG